MRAVVAVSAFSFLAVPLLAQEPSLAELAARQKKARTGQARVITDEDLKGTRPREAAATPADAKAPANSTQPATDSVAGAKPVGAEKGEAEQRAEKKADLEGKVKQWNAFIVDTRKAMDEAQLELNDLSSLTFGNRRAGLQKILDAGQQHLTEAQQAIADLEEQARRAGIALSR